jgi:hypothetical protein
MRCSDCKFWGDEDTEWLSHAFKNNPKLKDMRECQHPEPMWASFGEGVQMEGITTKPDFGCVQFKDKEPA